MFAGDNDGFFDVGRGLHVIVTGSKGGFGFFDGAVALVEAAADGGGVGLDPD